MVALYLQLILQISHHYLLTIRASICCTCRQRRRRPASASRSQLISRIFPVEGRIILFLLLNLFFCPMTTASAAICQSANLETVETRVENCRALNAPHTLNPTDLLRAAVFRTDSPVFCNASNCYADKYTGAPCAYPLCEWKKRQLCSLLRF